MNHSQTEILAFATKCTMAALCVFVTNYKWLCVGLGACSLLLVALYLRWLPHMCAWTNHVRVASLSCVFYCSIVLVFVVYHPAVDSGDLLAVLDYRKRVGAGPGQQLAGATQPADCTQLHASFPAARPMATLTMWAGMAPAALLGGLASWLHLRFYRVTVVKRFQTARPGTKPKFIHRFTDARQVEVAARCCRQWVDLDTLEPGHVSLAEQIIKAGVAQLPKSTFMIVLYASFLIEVQSSFQTGYSQLQPLTMHHAPATIMPAPQLPCCLGPAAPDRATGPDGPEQAAKKNKPGLLDRFAIFIREQQHTQKAGDLVGGWAHEGPAASSAGRAAVSGGQPAATALLALLLKVNYVEQQRKYRMALRLHKDALLAMRSFWQCLLHTSIEMSKLRDALELVDLKVKAGKRCAPHCLQPLAPAAWPGMRSVPLLQVTPSAWPAADLLCCAAEQLYRSQLAGASTNVKLLRLYAKFLEHIKHDPWGAAKWTAEARRLQLIEDERKDNIFSDMGGNNGDENQPAWVQHMKGVDPGKAVIVMDAQCIVQAANQVAHTMFGYAKNELRGRNVNLIIPPPFAEHHDQYIRNYIAT
ncbi:hypothetical protein QJQ45_016806, partial [Haematococcus lacustris]